MGKLNEHFRGKACYSGKTLPFQKVEVNSQTENRPSVIQNVCVSIIKLKRIKHPYFVSHHGVRFS